MYYHYHVVRPVLDLYLLTIREPRDIWIGFCDLDPGSLNDASFKWTDCTDPGQFINLANGKNNDQGNQKCVLYKHNHKLKKKECSDEYATVCEKETSKYFKFWKVKPLIDNYIYSLVVYSFVCCLLSSIPAIWRNLFPLIWSFCIPFISMSVCEISFPPVYILCRTSLKKCICIAVTYGSWQIYISLITLVIRMLYHSINLITINIKL